MPQSPGWHLLKSDGESESGFYNERLGFKEYTGGLFHGQQSEYLNPLLVYPLLEEPPFLPLPPLSSSSAEVSFWGYVLLLSVAWFRAHSNTSWSMDCLPDKLPFCQVLFFYISVQNCYLVHTGFTVSSCHIILFMFFKHFCIHDSTGLCYGKY